MKIILASDSILFSKTIVLHSTFSFDLFIFLFWKFTMLNTGQNSYVRRGGISWNAKRQRRLKPISAFTGVVITVCRQSLQCCSLLRNPQWEELCWVFPTERRRSICSSAVQEKASNFPQVLSKYLPEIEEWFLVLFASA